MFAPDNLSCTRLRCCKPIYPVISSLVSLILLGVPFLFTSRAAFQDRIGAIEILLVRVYLIYRRISDRLWAVIPRRWRILVLYSLPLIPTRYFLHLSIDGVAF